MSDRAPVVIAMVVRDEAHNLQACLESIRPHVERLVIVDTGSVDETPAIAKPFADAFEIWTGCNNGEGKIANFAVARNRAFGMARGLKRPPRHVMWIDGDDLVRNGAQLVDVLKDLNARSAKNNLSSVTLPYDVPPLVYPRERIVPLQFAEWTGRVHEVLMLRTGKAMIPAVECCTTDDRVVIHHAPSKDKPREQGRNLRILRQQFQDDGYLPPRETYYLGRECIDNGIVAEGLKWLEHYTAIGTWADERCGAFLRMTEAHLRRVDHDAAEITALRAVGAKPDWAEPRLMLARVYYYRAMRATGGARDGQDFARVVSLIPEALTMPPTVTGVFLDRTLRTEAHVFLNLAYDKVGRVADALASAEAGLRELPGHPQLTINQKLYREHLKLPPLPEPEVTT